jgi:hypothetical protein
MTPQEKARELVMKFARELGTFINPMIWQMSKQCAIICCEEVIANSYECAWMEQKNRIETQLTKHYKEVIEEINKL